jgi:hypothetical protein
VRGINAIQRRLSQPPCLGRPYRGWQAAPTGVTIDKRGNMRDAQAHFELVDKINPACYSHNWV